MGNVILIGFMGCGKSSIAVKLSYRLKQAMVDTDRWIEKKQGKTITEIFAQDGEEAFRQMETDALKYLKETAKNQVISRRERGGRDCNFTRLFARHQIRQ